MWGKLCPEAEEKEVYAAMQSLHAEMLQHFERGGALMEPLLAQFVEAACDDPAAAVLPKLVAPLIRERLEACAAASLVSTLSAEKNFDTAKER